MTSLMAADSGDHARPLPPGRAALLRYISIAILAWGSIWIFLFQHATVLQRDLLFHPVLAISALVAVIVAGHRPRLEPWTYWFGAVLAYTILGSASNPSFFASWERVHSLLVSVAFGIPILLALRQAEIGPRILCGACIALSLAGLLDNVGVDLRAGIASLANTELVSEETRIEIVTDRSNVSYWRSQRSHEVWILCLAWIALAALRPSTRRDWLVAAVVLAVTGLAVATGYSSATPLIFIVGVGVFGAAFSAPRITLGLSLAAVFVFFLGAPVWANALWSWYVNSPETFDASTMGTSRLIPRVANWEYWAELIERQPWTGLGVGAYWKLPFLPLADVFGARPSAVLHPDMVSTSFPHNLPLQVWGDLGVFGVLLVTGLVASLFVNAVPARLPGRDAGAAARFTLLATVLLVYSVDRAVWTEQNLFQLFLAAGLAAGTLTARAREAPAVTLPGLSLRREKLLIGAVLLIGSVVAVGNSARIHLADSRYVPERTVLDLERGVLRDGAEETPLDGRAVGFIERVGYVDRGARGDRDAMTVSGWAYDPAATGEALQVLVFDGTELLGVTRTGRARPDLQRTSTLPNVDLLFTGFELRLPRPPEWWPPKTEVNAVYLGPSGSASLARVTDSARRRLEAVPAGASGFYVYVDEIWNELVYARDDECSEDDTAPPFFLQVVPVDKDDLPDFRRQYSYDNFDFHFNDYGFRKDGRCFATIRLPDYDIAEIRTGQSIRGQGVLWEEHLGAVPVSAFGFDVYVDETRHALVYARDECSEDDTAPLFFLHVIPVDEDDLPDFRRQYSYDNFDFHFDDHGFRKDGRCFATIRLPGYDIAEIRTGQSIGGRALWEEYLGAVRAPGFDASVDETRHALVYARDECSEDDTAPLFFLHVVPVDKDDLPDFRRQYSYDNFDFHFDDHGFRKDGRCFATIRLPGYDIAEIRTGQSIRGRALWEEYLGAVRAPGFDVSVDETRHALVYARDECSEDDTAPLFFLHVVPVDKDDLPDFRRQYSYDNFDFHFDDYGFKKDGRCFVTTPLPDYDIAEIRTGQSIRGEGVLWEEHFTFNR